MNPFPLVTREALLTGLAVLLTGLLLGWMLRAVVRRALRARSRSEQSARTYATVVQSVVSVLAVMGSLTVIFPSIRPVDLLGGIGVVTLAAGIAFQTVLGNIFAGLVILYRDRFRVGDQVRVGEHAGTIVDIHLSSTAIRTFDGRLALVPNTTMHSSVVVVQTGYETVRSSLHLDIDDGNDLELVRRVAEEAMASVPAVRSHPAPAALFSSVGATTVRSELRFWSGALQMETREAQHEVIVAVLDAFRRHGIKTGDDLQVIDPGPWLREHLTGRPADRDQPG